jgi:DNA repair exonuclease SbcCD nuclease subunit
MVKVGAEVFDGWDHVFLGHYHGEQKLEYNVEYIGSPLQLSFGEAFQHKHVLIFDLDTCEKEYVRNEFSPKHFIIPQKDIAKYDLENNFVRIMVEDIGQADLIDLRTELLSNNKLGSLEFKPVEKKVDETIVEDAKAILLKENEMLEKYVATQELGEMEKEKLLEIGRAICNAI